MVASPERLRVLISAYACEPNRGSEPGVGWEWATRMSSFHDVTVLTRTNNQVLVDAALQNLPQTNRPRVIYLDLSPWVLNLKKRGVLPVFLYYILWQLSAARRFQKQAELYDLIHHVTFNGFRFPGAWWSKSTKIILGPLGGGSIAAPQYRRCYEKRWIIEKVREYTVRLWQWNPWTVASLKNARMVMVVGEDLQKRFCKAGVESQMMLETALPQALAENCCEIPPHEKKDFIWVGNLEPWKAWQIALEAFAQAVSKGLGESRLKVIGKGTQASEAKNAAVSLGVSDRIDFIDQLPRDEVWELMATSRALIFSSIRDTSGNVVLEAMGLRCPIICFQHQGVAMMTDANCAYRIPPSDWPNAIDAYSNAIITLAKDDNLVGSLGNAGRERALSEFTWDSKVSEMLKIYSKVYLGQ